MVNGNSGKGGHYRKVDPKKWNEGYNRIWKKEEGDKMKYFCHNCQTHFDGPDLSRRSIAAGQPIYICSNCRSENIVEKSDNDEDRNDLPKQGKD